MRVIKNAIATKSTADFKTKEFTGAVYENYTLVKESLRNDINFSGKKMFWRSGDSIKISDKLDVSKSYNGKYLYLGHFHCQFGHFLLETLSQLSHLEEIDVNDFDGIVFHSFKQNYSIDNNFLELDIVSWALSRRKELSVIIINDQDVMFEEVVVVPRLFEIQKDASDKSFTIADKYLIYKEKFSKGQQTRSKERKLFLSRSKITNDRRGFSNDLSIDQYFQDIGYKVIFPEELSIDEQINLVSRADYIAGLDGSALHLSIFAPNTCKITSLNKRGLNINSILAFRCKKQVNQTILTHDITAKNELDIGLLDCYREKYASFIF